MVEGTTSLRLSLAQAHLGPLAQVNPDPAMAVTHQKRPVRIYPGRYHFRVIVTDLNGNDWFVDVRKTRIHATLTEAAALKLWHHCRLDFRPLGTRHLGSK